VTGPCLAFRRADFAARGPLDERFRTPAHLDTWWSLVLRDGSGDDADGAEPAEVAGPGQARAHRNRRAVVVPGLPIAPRTLDPDSSGSGGPRDRDRIAKRSFYRLLDRFRGRLDLAGSRPGGASARITENRP
jgi:hypothetical protein